MDLPAGPLNLPAQVATAVFRVFQEALTNVGRHAKATVVRVLLKADPEQLLLQVEDNGQGIQPEATADSHSLGLLGMRERAAVLGGEATISPITPHGTRVSLRLPRAATDAKFWAEI